ncbi:MAG: cytoskeleton protein RodZ [Gammaproteobacteria bacterium]|jgi:cytoskeleton protein RodZ
MTDAHDQVTQVSAGEQLKHLREQKNLSVQNIASRLNLEIRIIEAIESNNFDVLPAATYARGYLRSYAKILGVDPEAIVSTYNDDAPDPPEIIPEIKHPSQRSSSDKPVRAFTYLISLTLVILLVAWFYSNFIVDKMSFGSNYMSDTETEPGTGLSYSYPIIEHSSSPYFRAIEPAEEASDNLDETSSVMGLDDEIIADVDRDRDFALEVSTDNEGPDSIVLRLTTESWIEVRDSTDNKVFGNLAHEGQVIRLKGTAPFSIVLGVAEGVSVEFNGDPFDILPYTKGGIARFSLGR